MMSLTDFVASSFPGITKSIPSGSQFVSQIAKTGMFNLFASLTALYSTVGSTTIKALGIFLISLIPSRFLASLSFSLFKAITSFLGSFSQEPSS